MRLVVGVCLVLVALGGCEKLPSWFPGQPSSGAKAATTAASQVTPGRPTVLPDDTMALVNGVAVSKADVELRVQELKALVQNFGQEWKPLTTEQLESIVTELVNSELMAQDAVQRGLDRNLDAQRRFEFARRAFFSQEWLRFSQQRLEVSAEKIEEYYNTYKQGFQEPERRKLRQLTVAGEDEAKRALARLLDGSADFEALAKQISVAPTASQGGLMDKWVMRGQEKALRFGSEPAAEAAGVASLDPALEAAAFAVDQPKGLSSYAKGADNRYHLFQLVERQESKQIPLSDVYDQIKNMLSVQQLQASLDEIRQRAQIERFSQRLERIEQ